MLSSPHKHRRGFPDGARTRPGTGVRGWDSREASAHAGPPGAGGQEANVKLAYAAIRVRNLVVMAEWYAELLGQPPDRPLDPERLARDPWIQFTLAGGAALALVGTDPVAPCVFGGDFDRGLLYLACPVMETLDRLRRAEQRVEGPVVDGPMLQATVVDPEGNRVRLLEWLNEGGPAD